MPTFYGGAIYFDGADAATVIDRWRGWADELPEQGTTSFVIFQLPPMPDVPPPLAGRMTLGVRFVWTGEPEEGARLLNQMRDVAPVILDDANLRPYTEIDHVHADPVDPMPVVDPAILLNAFPAEAAERLLAVAGYGSGSPQVMVEVRHLGGAYAREGAYPSAFSHRAAKFSVLTVARRGRRGHGCRRAGARRPGVLRAGRLGHRRRVAELRHPARRRLGATLLRRADAGPAP